MPVKSDMLEDIRDTLIRSSPKEQEATRVGYINGVLDFYNAMKKFDEEVKDECDYAA